MSFDYTRRKSSKQTSFFVRNNIDVFKQMYVLDVVYLVISFLNSFFCYDYSQLNQRSIWNRHFSAIDLNVIRFSTSFFRFVLNKLDNC